MLEYGLAEDVNLAIVTGMLNGHKSYLNERNQKKEELLVSGGYSWVRGNHIDHHVAKKIQTIGCEYNISKAGSWDYIQMVVKNEDEKYLVFVKPQTFIEDHEKNPKGYVVAHGKFNENLVNSIGFKEFLGDSYSEQMDFSESLGFFLPSDIKEIQSDYDRLYLISYELDSEKLISGVQLFVPYEKQVYSIADLSEYIEKSGVEYTDEEKGVAMDDESTPEELVDTPNHDLFNFGIASPESKEQPQ